MEWGGTPRGRGSWIAANQSAALGGGARARGAPFRGRGRAVGGAGAEANAEEIPGWAPRVGVLRWNLGRVRQLLTLYAGASNPNPEWSRMGCCSPRAKAPG